MMDDYCPNCGEHVDRGLTDEPGMAPCDGCEQLVEPISDSRDAAMPFKALHTIRCSKCQEEVRLVGLHMGQYSDGVLAACDCMSIDSIPYELGEPELPDQWEVLHDTEAFSEPEAPDPGPLEKFA